MNLFYLCFALASANGLIAQFRNGRFLAETPSMASAADMERFEALVRWNMYSALVQIALLGTAGLLGVIGIARGQMGLLTVLALNGAIIAFGRYMKHAEDRTRSLPVTDPQLEDRYRKLCGTWVRRALPDF